MHADDVGALRLQLDAQRVGQATTPRPSTRSTHRSAGIENHDSTDSTLTSAPPPLAASTGANARVTASVPEEVGVHVTAHVVERTAEQRRARRDARVVHDEGDVAELRGCRARRSQRR